MTDARPPDNAAGEVSGAVNDRAPQPGLRAKTARGIVWSGIQTGYVNALSTGVYFLLLAILKPEDFGIVAAAGLLIVALQIVVDGGFAEAIVQRKEMSDSLLATAFWTSAGMAVILAGALIAGSGWIVRFFQTERPELLQHVIMSMCAMFPIMALQSVPTALLRRQMRFRPLAMRAIAGVTAGSIAGVIIAFAGGGVWALVAQQLIGGVVNCATLWTVSDWRPSFRYDTSAVRELLGFNGSVLGVRAMDLANTRLEQFLIGGFLGVTALGLYAVGVRLVTTILQTFYSTLGAATLRAFSSVQSEPARLRSAFLDGVGLVQLVAMPAFVGLAYIAHDLMGLFDPEWLKAAFVLQVTCVIGIARAATFFNASMVTALGKPHYRLVLGSVSVVLNVVGFFIGAQWGIEGVAVAIAIRTYLVAPFSLLLVRHMIQFRLRDYARRFVAPIGGCALMLGVLYGLDTLLPRGGHPVWPIVAMIVAGAISYGIALLVLAPTATSRALDTLDHALPVAHRLTGSLRRLSRGSLLPQAGADRM